MANSPFHLGIGADDEVLSKAIINLVNSTLYINVLLCPVSYLSLPACLVDMNSKCGYDFNMVDVEHVIC